MLNKAPNAVTETRLRNRRMTMRDAPQVARWMIEDLPVPSILAAELGGVLRSLLKNERLFGVCVEEELPEHSPMSLHRQLVAFGVSAFINDECVTAQMESPLAYFWLELLDRVRRAEVSSGLLTMREIAEANAGDGLNLYPFLWLQRPKDFSDPLGGELIRRAMRLLLDDHLGYNLKRILKEASRNQEDAYTRGGLIRLKACGGGASAAAAERILFGLTREQAKKEAFGSALSLLFESVRPRCGFTRIQQQVLQCAVDDMTDEEIAEHLGVSPHTVNMRWRTIYERMEPAEDVGAEISNDGERSNGKNRASDGHVVQKRRRVVAYMRAHPEELRPYAWR
jgi:hypothetical protein